MRREVEGVDSCAVCVPEVIEDGKYQITHWLEELLDSPAPSRYISPAGVVQVVTVGVLQKVLDVQVRRNHTGESALAKCIGTFSRMPKFVLCVLDLLRRQNKAVISPMSGAKKRAAIDGRRFLCWW